VRPIRRTNGMSTLVCGATGAIGAALARRIFSRGGTLVLAGRSESSLQSLSKELGNATYRVTDFSKPESVAASLGDLPEDLQGFAYAVGSITLKRITAARPADYESSFALNVISASEAFKASMPGLKKNKGSAVFFSSVAASKGFASHAVVRAACLELHAFLQLVWRKCCFRLVCQVDRLGLRHSPTHFGRQHVRIERFLAHFALYVATQASAQHRRLCLLSAVTDKQQQFLPPTRECESYVQCRWLPAKVRYKV